MGEKWSEGGRQKNVKAGGEGERRQERACVGSVEKKWCPAVNSITHTVTKEQDSKRRAKLVHTCSPTLVGQLDRRAIKVPVKLSCTSARKCHFYSLTSCPPPNLKSHSIIHSVAKWVFQTTSVVTQNTASEWFQAGSGLITVHI